MTDRMGQWPGLMAKPTGKDWVDRHNRELDKAVGAWTVEGDLVDMLVKWRDYAADFESRHNTQLGSDGVLGDAWLLVGRGLRELLNGDTGELDCGTLDKFILTTARVAGFSEEEIEG